MKIYEYISYVSFFLCLSKTVISSQAEYNLIWVTCVAHIGQHMIRVIILSLSYNNIFLSMYNFILGVHFTLLFLSLQLKWR
jgi:hypothetical protein